MTVAAAPIEGGEASSEDDELAREAERITQLIDEIGTMGGAVIRQRMEEAVRNLVHLYGAGLERLMKMLASQSRESQTEKQIAADPLLSSLLLLHGLHPGPSAAADVGGLVQIDLARSRSKTDPQP
ncbi:MAG TPA: hypothetical protein VGL59_08220 [Polyangia bacterium]